MHTEDMRIRADGRTVFGTFYDPEAGEARPLVIFSHGFNGSGKDFDAEARALAENGYCAFCFDFCGGSLGTRSDLTTREMTIGTEREDLGAVLEELSLDRRTDKKRIVLFGGSQGGLVTALVAADRPQDVAAVFLLFPALCIPDDWTRAFPDRNAVPETFSRWGVPLGREFVRSVHGMDVFAHIAAYRGHVLILHGDADDVVPLAYSRRAQGVYPDAELTVLPGEGHGFSPAGNAEVLRRLLGLLADL